MDWTLLFFELNEAKDVLYSTHVTQNTEIRDVNLNISLA